MQKIMTRRSMKKGFIMAGRRWNRQGKEMRRRRRREKGKREKERVMIVNVSGDMNMKV